MIAQPTRNRPWLPATFVVTFSLIACYAFTTVRAAEEEKPLPPKDRSRETTRGERERDATGPRETDGDGKMKEGQRDGERPREGAGDGDRPKTGERDGARKKTGDGDGAPRKGERDGDTKKTGPRDGEKSRTGAKDGDQPKNGERDGARPKTGDRDSAAARTESANGEASGGTIAMHVTKRGDAVVIGGEEIELKRLRGHLHSLLADRESPKAAITADGDVPFDALAKVIDAVRDNGIKNPEVRSTAKE